VVFGVVVFVGFSTLLAAVLARFEEEVFVYLPDTLHGPIDVGLVWMVSIVLMTGALSLIYRFLPDAKIAWREVFPGALFAAIGLEGLKSLVAIYLRQQELTHIYGTAGSLVALLVWLYASANVVFLGAEVARVWSGRLSGNIEVEEGARLNRNAMRLELTPKLKRALLGESVAEQEPHQA
jgi:membrane protein